VLRRIRWDPGKAQRNLRKHGISFDEAQRIFLDPLLVCIDDREHSGEEDRYFAIGETREGKLLAVSYTIRDDEAWLITARTTEPAERRRYMKGDRIRDRGDEEVDPSGHLDWSKAKRGPLIIPRGPITVTIEPELAEFFRDEKAVNDALSSLFAHGLVGPWSRD
jgi:uncharacterized protein